MRTLELIQKYNKMVKPEFKVDPKIDSIKRIFKEGLEKARFGMETSIEIPSCHTKTGHTESIQVFQYFYTRNGKYKCVAVKA